MGSPAAERNRLANENQVKVTISKGFYLGKCSVTQREFKALMKSAPWQNWQSKDDDDSPATYVDWRDAAEFCRKLTVRESQAGRLPGGFVYALPTERSGSTPVAPARPRPIPSATTRWASRNAPGGGAARRRKLAPIVPAASVRRSRIRGASTTCTATCWNGASTPSRNNFREEPTRSWKRACVAQCAADPGRRRPSLPVGGATILLCRGPELLRRFPRGPGSREPNGPGGQKEG